MLKMLTAMLKNVKSNAKNVKSNANSNAKIILKTKYIYKNG